MSLGAFRDARFLTVREVADFMRVSTMTIYRLIGAGSLPAIRFGRRYRIRDTDMHRYLEDRYIRAG